MSRYDPILEYIDKAGCGVEIGPSFSPFAPKSKGYNVHVVDHLNRESLIEKYTGHNVNLDNIEEVDYVWKGEKYSDLLGRKNYYDWVIASHVIEHTPDMVAFLCDCEELLADNGILMLAVPDARYCFDYFRQITSLSTVIDAYLNKNRVHTSGTAVDCLLNSCQLNGSILWDTVSVGDFRFFNSVTDAKRLLTNEQDLTTYEDCHAWCFTPHSFRLMMNDLFNLGLIALQEVKFIPTGGTEFFMILSRYGEGPGKSRLEMLKMTKKDLAQKETLYRRIHSWLYRERLKLSRRIAMLQGKA